MDPALRESRLFDRATIAEIQRAAREGMYDIRGFGAKRSLPHFDDLLLLGASISRYPLEGYRERCATDVVLGTRFARRPLELKIPVTIAGMSFGALSAPAKEALGRGATEVGTSTTANGDGIDPDSSTGCYIFNCSFDTGDDCIAIKSGKNPEGFFVARPTKNVRVTDCDFKRGHGISIGSEMSGGVSDVLVQDCRAGALLNGMQIKGTKERGGYVKNITVTDCQLLKITVFSAVNYNNDGAAAPEVPTFENFTFKNIDLSQASTKEPVIDINGFKEAGHRLKDVTFTNILMPENSKVVINNAERTKFVKVKSLNGLKPEYIVRDSDDISY